MVPAGTGQWSAVCRSTFFYLLIISSTEVLTAQDKLLPVFHFRNLSIATGLSSNSVMSQVVRDKDGFVWIGTSGGLDRWDGFTTKHYRHLPGDGHSLSSNFVYALTIDSKGRLWVGTYETGICLYDPARDRFVNLTARSGDSTSYLARGTYAIRDDSVGDLWLATDNGGVVRVHIPAGAGNLEPESLAASIRTTTYSLGTKRNFAHDLCVWPDGRVFVGSDSGLVIIDPTNHSLSRLDPENAAARALDTIFIATLVPDGKGNLWVGSGAHGLFLLNVATRRAVNYRHRDGDRHSIKSDEVHHILPNDQGDLWLSTGKGLDLFSPATGRALPYLTAGQGPQGSYCWWLSKDNSGTLWLGTEVDGLYMLTAKSLRYPLYSVANSDGGPRPFEGIVRDRHGAWWFASRGDIMNIDIPSLSVLRRISVFRETESVMGGFEANAIEVDSAGYFWYGSYENGLHRIDLASGTSKSYRYASRTGTPPSVRSMARAPGNRFWIGTRQEPLLLFDPATGSFETFQRLYTLFAYGVMTARDGTLWVSAEVLGLIHFHPHTGEVERYVHAPGNPASISAGIVYRTFEDPGGGIWAGAGTAIDRWDPATRTFRHYPHPDFNPQYYVYPLGMDGRRKLWIGNDLCTSLLDPSTGTFEDLDTWTDLCGDPVDMDSLSDGRILLTGTRGINLLSPDSLRFNCAAPPLLITSLKVNDDVISLSSTGENSIRLSYQQNVIELEFAATDIVSPHLVQYRYQLEGLEREWVDPKTRRSVRYAGLQPGDFVFRLRAMSARDEWPRQDIALKIYIGPPWWLTSWAYGAYVLGFAGLLLSGYRLRLRQIRLQQQVEMEHFKADQLGEVDRLKSRFFANLSHEFRTPLTLILGPMTKWMDRMDPSSELHHDLGIAETNARRLLRLVNQLLDLSQLEAGSMSLRVSRMNLIPIIKGIAYSFESSAGLRHITLTVNVPGEEIMGYVDRDKLEKILGNLLSNAFKFTPEGGTVTLESRYQISDIKNQNSIHFCRIAVTDTGPGIPAQHVPRIFDRFYRVDDTHRTEGTGIGLSLVKELVELHHGSVEVKSEYGRGTEFVVNIPLERSHYKESEIIETPEITGARPGEPASLGLPPAVAKPPEIGWSGVKPVVLVVEDNADVRAYVRSYLFGAYEVLEACDGGAGIERARAAVPDLIISDVMMPVNDGYELCKALKTDEKTSHIPIILLTAKAATDDRIDGLETGADDYLVKPFEPRELLARVKNLIEVRHALRERFSVALRPGEISVPSMEDAFLKRLINVVEKRMGDETFGVEALATCMNMSRVQVHRKIKALTNQSASDFVRYMRLHRGMDLLKRNAGTVAEIAYSVGFGDPSHFTRRFHEQFGVTPSEVRKGPGEPT